MAAKEKTFVIFVLLLLLIYSSAGNRDGVQDVVKLSKLHQESYLISNEAMIRRKARKLIGVNGMLDYYEGGPNPAHEPGKGKSGGKGGNNP